MNALSKFQHLCIVVILIVFFLALGFFFFGVEEKVLDIVFSKTILIFIFLGVKKNWVCV